MSPSIPQSFLKRYAACRNCKEDLVIEEDSARQALFYGNQNVQMDIVNQKKKKFYPNEP